MGKPWLQIWNHVPGNAPMCILRCGECKKGELRRDKKERNMTTSLYRCVDCLRPVRIVEDH